MSLRDRADACCRAVQSLHDSGLNALLSFDPASITAQADAVADREDLGSLAGIAVAVKDNICTLDHTTTCASRMLADYQSPFEATAVARLRTAGALIAAKTNLDEFGMGSSTEHSAFGPCLNPVDRTRVPGGSSGGSAVAVAVGATEVALGSDTGGSVRQPAAFCGVVGFKPTYGRVSRYGLVAFGSSLDQIGVLGRHVKPVIDAATVISGADHRDSTSWGEPIVAEADVRLEKTVVGVPREYFPDDLHPGVRAACDGALRRLRSAGVTVREISLPHAPLAVPTYYVIAPAEASANLARYDGVRYGSRVAEDEVLAMLRATRGQGFGREVQRRILVGTYVLSSGYYDAYYGRALTTRALVAADFDHAFASGVDLLFTPTTPTPAFPLGSHARDPVAMYAEDRFVCGANLAGIPAISVPIGEADDLPVGGQLMGPWGEDGRVLAVAAHLESLLSNGAPS